MQSHSDPRKTLGANFLLLLGSVLVCVLVVEVGFRIVRPPRAFRAATELENFRLNEEDLTQYFEIDPSFGFRPILGTELYSEYGTRTNDYEIESSQGRERLLFVGDSVTAQGHIITALRRILGEKRFEYWNAGVHSFNTVQEVVYYRRYNAATNPDHVILTFHLNDFGTTPIAFEAASGLVVYSPNRPLRSVSPWLFRYSRTYRLVLGLLSTAGAERRAVIEEMRGSLESLRDDLDRADAELTVLVLPLLKPFEEWSEDDRRQRNTIHAILEELGIRRVDLLDPLTTALEGGVVVTETPGDLWHPSLAVSRYFARHVRRSGVLATGR